MSKRHQTSRRRSYGRRQHELHERGTQHRSGQIDAEMELDGYGDRGDADTVAFLGPRDARLRYAVGE